LGQEAINVLKAQFKAKELILNDEKTSELISDFTKNKRLTNNLPVTRMGDIEVKRVEEKRLLGYQHTDILKPTSHIRKTVATAKSRIYLLYKLRKLQVPKNTLLTFYEQAIRSPLEYLAPLYHYALSEKDTKSLERIRKRAWKCVDDYDDRFVTTLAERRETRCQSYLAELIDRESKLIPRPHQTLKVTTRYCRKLIPAPYARTKRRATSFVPAAIASFNNQLSSPPTFLLKQT
jgi:hypothetical protein